MEYLGQKNYDAVKNYDEYIKKLEKQLNNPIFSSYYDSQSGKLLTYLAYCKKIDKEYKDLKYTIGELTVNYTLLDSWSYQDFIDFNDYKKRQKNE